MLATGSNGQQMKALQVKVEMEGKRILTGSIIIDAIKSLSEALNDNRQFLEFSTPTGALQFISKKTIVHIESIEDVKEADQLEENTNFDPYELLGIPKNASHIDVQHAYHLKARLYHPDRYHNSDLPAEVLEYVMTMSQRINIAYTEVCRQKYEQSDGKQYQTDEKVDTSYAV